MPRSRFGELEEQVVPTLPRLGGESYAFADVEEALPVLGDSRRSMPAPWKGSEPRLDRS
jgi:hypothetical protein